MRRLAPLAAVAALLAPTTPVWAQTATPAVAAQPAAAAPVSELASEVNIPWTRFQLDNGLTVIVHEDRKAPVVAVSVWYNVGSKDEPQGRTGFAHLFEHLMFGGSENAPGSYITTMRNVGATDLNGTTWFDRTNYFQTVPTPALEQALYLESDRMGYMLGAVSQETLDIQRGVVQNEKRQGDNEPFGLFEYAQLETLFPEGHPYRHSTIGSMADLDAASMETVRDWFRSKYGPNNAVLVLAGDIDEATARTLAQRYFGGIARGPVNTPAAADVPTLPAPVHTEMRDRVANTRIYREWVVPGMLDPDITALSVGASVLGGLASSRLDNELVRGDQTAVQVVAHVQDFHRVGFFEVYADVKPGQDHEAVGRRLDAIIADLIANGPTQDEIDRVVASQVSARILGLEQVGGFSGKATALAEGQLYAGDPDFYRTQLRDLAAVTPASVQAAMRKWLSRPVWTVTVQPGEREAYVEAAEAPSGATPTPAEPIERVARDARPEIGQVADLAFPTTERAQLSNGIQVIYARAANVPVTRVTVDLDAGYAADAANRLGEQSLMLDLMDEGAAGMDATRLAEVQERLGARIATGASVDRSFVSLTAVTPNLAPSLTLLSNVVRQPTFDPAEVERLKAQRLVAIAGEKTQPTNLALRAMPEILYGEGHPYGRPLTGTGEEAAVTALTAADIRAAHDAWIRPDNAVIFVTSDRPLSEIQPQLEAAFGDWRARATARGQKDFSAAVPAATPRIILINRPQSPQSFILGGELLPLSGTDDLLTFTTANNVLGADFSSRINTELRERRSWSYGVQGYANTVQGRLPYFVQAPVQADRTGDSIAALLAQYRQFRAEGGGVTPQELERTINGNTRRLAGSYETSAAVMSALRGNYVYRRADNYQETIASRTRAFTAPQLDEAARVIDPERLVWVVVGDAAVVQPQLEQLGLPVEVRQASE